MQKISVGAQKAPQQQPLSQSNNKIALSDHQEKLKNIPELPQPAEIHKPRHHIKSQWKIYCMVLNACLGSWYFGYNLGVYNSAQRVVQELNNWTEDEYTKYTAVITALMPLGAFIGCIFSKFIIEKLNGIRKTMLVFDVIGILGQIILIGGTTLPNLLIGRLVTGFVVGINTAIVPVYIREFAPVEISGKLGGVNQVVLTFGTFCAYLAALLVPLTSELKQINYTNPVNWRILLGLPIVTCLIRFVLLLFLYKLDTPTYMLKQHRYEEIKNYLQQVYEKDEWKDVFIELEEKVHFSQKKPSSQQSMNSQSHNEIENKQYNQQNNILEQKSRQVEGALGSLQTNQDNILQPGNTIIVQPKTEMEFYHEKLYELGNNYSYKMRFFIGTVIQIANQFSGINSILFYSNEIFKTVSGSEQTARICTIFIGVNNVLITFVSIILLGCLGRRTFMLFGLTVIQITMYVMAILQKQEQTSGVQIFGIVLVFIYLQGWQVSLGAVLWVYNTEILDSTGISFSTFVRWFCAMIIGVAFPYMKEDIKIFGAFLLFGCFTTLSHFILYFTMKETAYKDRYEILEGFCKPEKWKQFELESHQYAKEMMRIQNENQGAGNH